MGQKNSTIQIAHYIKNKKPSIDIHLLGCTELKFLRELSFCSSADSTSYIAGNQFGYIKGNHVKYIKKEKIIELVGKETYDFINSWNNEQYTNTLCLSIYSLNHDYVMYAGNQD
jgi:thermostable 8-oxoguanine DNA glycosylase